MTPCPHVTPPMVALGFTVCGVCETSHQQGALEAAYVSLGAAFDEAAAVATEQAKACRRKTPRPDMGRWLSVVRYVAQAETGVDTAAYDRATAAGADG